MEFVARRNLAVVILRLLPLSTTYFCLSFLNLWPFKGSRKALQFKEFVD
jgi:hypothetical protein